jgi:hypothetical protein
MRCAHIQGVGNRGEKVRNKGCYFLEKGGKNSRWYCKREDCKGHVYSSRRMKKDKKGVSCFGKKGERIVCSER